MTLAGTVEGWRPLRKRPQTGGTARRRPFRIFARNEIAVPIPNVRRRNILQGREEFRRKPR